MSPTENAAARSGRLEALLAAGAHRAAAREARAVLADAAAAPDDRARAEASLASLAPDPVALVLGLAGVIGSLALAVWVTTGGAR